ncbi:MAG TPA: M48 family metallopeptidase [Thermoanaerobaculia bacterium]|nr:M48 family metallopeptidase [Thermoanaerobaculia bacterium]
MNARAVVPGLAILALASGLLAQPAPATPTPPGTSAASAASASASSRATYTLTPEKRAQAIAYARARYRLHFGAFGWGCVVLLGIIALRLGPRFRDLAESASRRRFVQAAVFVPLLFVTEGVLELPTAAYGHRLARFYGQSVQGWGSWLWDQAKGLLVGLVIAIPLVWLLYAILRRSPRRWWLWFWLALLPILVFLIFLTPLAIDPLFFRFDPLAPAHPKLAREIGKVAARAGEPIPPERMFEMNASTKYTGINAYVTGLGASKRVVVWDTTIAKATIPQTLFVFGHEMGHYVLHHVPRTIAFLWALLFVLLALGAWILGRLFGHPGRWGIRGLSDWASLPVLVLGLTVAGELTTPIVSTYSRAREHEADVFGLEAIHGLVPDSPRAAAEAFQVLGEVNLADPDPSPFIAFWLYDHPPLADRLRFAAEYDPWGKGESPRYVK